MGKNSASRQKKVIMMQGGNTGVRLPTPLRLLSPAYEIEHLPYHLWIIRIPYPLGAILAILRNANLGKNDPHPLPVTQF